MKIGEQITHALELLYEGEMAAAKANIGVYLRNPAGIGEHPDIIAAIDTQMEAYASAKEKLEALHDFS